MLSNSADPVPTVPLLEEKSDHGLQGLQYSRHYFFSKTSLLNSLTLIKVNISGAGCSKLTTSLVNVSLRFKTLILQIHCYFLLEKCENLLQCKRFSHFSNKK